MIIPPELPDTKKLRKALAQYAVINDYDAEVGLCAVMFALETFVLVPMSLRVLDGEQRIAFDHVVEDADMKVVHVYTTLEELRPVEDSSLILPYCLQKLVDEILIPGGFTGLAVDPDAAHCVYMKIYPEGVRIAARSVDRRSSL